MYNMQSALRFVTDTLPMEEVIRYLALKNVMVVKLCQMASNNDTFDEDLREIFKKQTDTASYTQDEIDHRELLYVTNKYNIELDDTEPIASGMIAIVFSGKIRGDSGQRVVIKLKRKQIKNRITNGFNDVSGVIKFLSIFTKGSAFYVNVVKQMDRLMRMQSYIESQCNFTEEIDNIRKIGIELGEMNNWEEDGDEEDGEDVEESVEPAKSTVTYAHTDHHLLKIPQVFNDAIDRIDPQFILMEEMPGTGISKYKNSEDSTKMVESLYDYLWYSTFVGKYLHADLHPGNIIVSHDTKQISMIDFGLVVNLSPVLKKHIVGVLSTTHIYMERGIENDIVKYALVAFDPPPDISCLTESEFAYINKLLLDMYTRIYTGNLTDEHIQTATDEIKRIMDLGVLNMDLNIVKYVLGTSMYAATIGGLQTDPAILHKIKMKTAAKYT